MGKLTDFLYARPSFLEGVARTFDLGGTLNNYNKALTARQADSMALSSDWLSVGNDLSVTVEGYASDYPALEQALLEQACAILAKELD